MPTGKEGHRMNSPAQMVAVLWVRAVIPLICLTAFLCVPSHPLAFSIVAVIALIDITVQFFHYKGDSVSYTLIRLKGSWIRDLIYALTIYLIYFRYPQIPALSLSPVTVLEGMVFAAAPQVIEMLSLFGGLILIRRLIFASLGFPVIHLSWFFFLITALIMAAVLGRLMTHQQQMQQRLESAYQKSHQTLSAIIDRILETNKIVLGDADRNRFDNLIKAVCDQDYNPEDCARLGHTISQTLQKRQHALSLLTEREREILTFMAQNLSYRAMAHKLQVSDGTIRAHASNIMQKAQVHNRQDAVTWAQFRYILPQNGTLLGEVSPDHYENG